MDPAAHARHLLETSLVWDNHGCMSLEAGKEEFLPELERYRAVGVDICSLNVGFDAFPWENTLLVLGHFRSWLRRFPERYLLVESVADVERARASGRLGITFDIEGGAALAGQLSMVSLYYDLGVRWMLIAYNRNNALGGGCLDEDSGLTDFGREVVREMERVGMVVCCSHTGHRTSMEVLEHACKPVIFSHSNANALWPHRRNITDEAIDACAASGGVIGINGVARFFGPNVADPERVAAQIDYVAQRVGSGHVGLALDYVFDMAELEAFLAQNPAAFPAADGYKADMQSISPEQVPEIVEWLMRRGYGDEDLRKILGGNHLRVAETVWR